MKKKGVGILILIVSLIAILIYILIPTSNEKPIEQNETTDNLDLLISNQFGLNLKNYEVTDIEQQTGRGAIYKASILVDNNPIELYYRFGWCSSGGTDCGWYMYFTSSSPETEELYQSVKNNFCNKLTSERHLEPTTCTEEPYDNSTKTRELCLNGDFETVIGNKKILAIDQIINRRWSGASKGTYPQEVSKTN